MEPEILGGAPMSTTRGTVLSWLACAAVLAALLVWPRLAGPLIGALATVIAMWVWTEHVSSQIERQGRLLRRLEDTLAAGGDPEPILAHMREWNDIAQAVPVLVRHRRHARAEAL